MPNKSAPVQRRRAPNGVVSAKPVAIRLLPAEIAKVQDVADRERRTVSAVCRLAMLRGLAEYDRDPRELTSPL